MHVIAKMRCSSIEDYGHSRRIKLNCVYDGQVNSSSEDRTFTKATPNGECVMNVDNAGVYPAFKLPERVDEGNGRYHVDHEAASTHYVLFVDAKRYSLTDVHRALEELDDPGSSILAG